MAVAGFALPVLDLGLHEGDGLAGELDVDRQLVAHVREELRLRGLVAHLINILMAPNDCRMSPRSAQ